MNDFNKPSCSSHKHPPGAGTPTNPPLLHPEEEEENRKHVQKIITALRLYRKYALARVHKTEIYLNSLPKRHQNMLTKYRNHLGVIRDCIDENQAVIRKMLQGNICINAVGASGEYTDSSCMHQDIDKSAVKISHHDMENPEHVDVEPFQILKAQLTLKLIARDWSEACAEEREQSYTPIIDAIEEFYKPGEFEVNSVKILVPGAGLGRLTYELACRGYECEGNEFSFFMLIASNFVLNQCREANRYTLYPWVHQYVNNLRMADQVAMISFPDVCPAQNPPKGNIMMAAGDFLEVYNEPNSYDCVATCFFIDCANNVVDFIETIYRILVPGGIWVNLGPLLYHFSDIQAENSIEPTYENIVLIIEMVGFEILRNRSGVRTKYAQNPNSMLKTEYESLFWVCRKPINANPTNAHDDDEDVDVDDNLDVNAFASGGGASMGVNSFAPHISGHPTFRNGYDKY